MRPAIGRPIHATNIKKILDMHIVKRYSAAQTAGIQAEDTRPSVNRMDACCEPNVSKTWRDCRKPWHLHPGEGMLALSRTAGYAILALSCLDDDADQWVLLKDIIGKVEVPGPYLAKILHALAKAGVVQAKRGYRGGFKLARPAAKLSIAEIADAVEGESWLGGCMLGFAQCSEERACPAHTVCVAERTQLRSFLERLTLCDVAQFERRRGAISGLAIIREPRTEKRGLVRATGKSGRKRRSGSGKKK